MHKRWKYRVRQVAAIFVLERQDLDSCGDLYWHILEHGYSWDWAMRVAADYKCDIL